MKIITPNDPLPQPIRTVVTVGNFDGVHLGHIRLISRTVALARERGAASVVVTFEPHTRSVVYPELSTMLLTTFDEKVQLLRNMGVDYVFCVDFDEKFRRLTQEEFVKNILADKLRARDWVMGEGHHVGQNLGGVKKNLHFVCGKYHICMFTESLTTADEAVISSTRIRGLVSEGRIAEAVSMLGHPYLIAARRVSGIKVGTKLGFPTLNFRRPADGKVLPPTGVYAAEIEIGGHHGEEPCRDATATAEVVGGGHASGIVRMGEDGDVFTGGRNHVLQGALYFGSCPTFTGRDAHFEFHALNYDGNAREPAIGEEVHLWLRKFIRPDIAFANERALADQIALDINDINKIFLK